eukprot:3445989-Prymnesium_polylepis.1
MLSIFGVTSIASRQSSRTPKMRSTASKTWHTSGGVKHAESYEDTILPDTQEGAVPHRDRPACIPWSVGVRVRVHHGILVCECVPTCHAIN